MKKLKCYYAHTMLSYNSTVEAEDVATLEVMGFKVINPNCKKVQLECKEYADANGKENTMEYFRGIIEDCNILAFRSLPDGSILSGVASEIVFAQENHMGIIELPCNLSKRMLTYPETKDYLYEVGFRKATWKN
ncbi:MAG: hypothetical protein ACOH2V_00795 [Candidatus Saccharimonadaceae bacterium]